jgi:predicted dehydrogenase/nucleoside-diphosphate-sugar epimerase
MGAPAADLRAGVVGAGMISEHHIGALQDLPGVELVGVFDADSARARARAETAGTVAYDSLAALIDAGANVIHVLTPPASHADVAIEALDRGAHVLIEKPVADSADEARRIGERAEAAGLVATVGHSLLFDPQMHAALAQVRAGALGDVVGVDVFRSSRYPTYEGGPLPPHMQQAAYPWRDLGIHCLYLFTELLGPINKVDAHWRSLGASPDLAFDEWRGLVECERGFGQLQLSWNGQPQESQVVIHGTTGSLRVDLFAMYRARRRSLPVPKAIERVTNAYAESARPLVEVPVNAARFATGRIKPYQGIRNFIADFYRRLRVGEPPAVTIEEGAVLVEWLERVAEEAEAEHAERLEQFAPSGSVDVLVTGAAGALGTALVTRLAAEGKTVRGMVRRPPGNPVPGVEYVIGNLGNPNDVRSAIEGAEVVVHAGAAKAGAWEEHRCATVIGTENVIAACREAGVAQLVHVSSLSVLHWALADRGEPLTEETPLEPRPDDRGPYTRAKLQAEVAVAEAAADGLPAVILRPGQIFGGPLPLINSIVAFRAGARFVVLGSGRVRIPLVYLDDVIDGIVAVIDRRLTSGEVIHLIDEEHLDRLQILALAEPGRPVVRVPQRTVEAAGRVSESALARLGRQSPLGPYRLPFILADARFESDRAARLLGWRPRVGVREGIRRVTDAV